MFFRHLIAGASLVFLALGSTAEAQTPEGLPVEEAPPPTEVVEPVEAAEPAPASLPSSAVVVGDGPLRVHVIPIRQQIGRPILYILRRGVREANERGAHYVAIDMNTPGGELGATLEIMTALGRFEGRTLTYINDEAISAGAFISAATDEIWFASPRGIIGAAAPVAGGGQEIDESMKQKILSYLRAKVRAISDEHPFRGEVVTAMMDAGYELKIDDEVLKPKGELLTLTGRESMREFGDPAQPLLGAGIAASLEELFAGKADGRPVEITRYEVTWSEQVAVWLMTISPLFLGVGMLMLFIEFKTPGFGIFGFLGVLLLGVVFFGHYIAGLSGHEPFLFFMVGLALVALEILLFPGLIFPALIGLLLMVGSLLWGMADIWPGQPVDISWETLLRPVVNLAIGVLLAIFLAAMLARFLPKSLFWDKMILAASITGDSGGGSASAGGTGLQPGLGRPKAGDLAVAVTDLFPSGQIEYGGARFEARVEIGSARSGDAVRVVRRESFGYVVEAVS
jgi:membrane-bound serine protease (ClpP class)